MKNSITSDELNSYIENRISEILSILKQKGKTYTGNENRFLNFNRASDILQQEPEQCLIQFATKHLVWLIDYVNQLKDNTEVTYRDIVEIDEKIGDIINYLLILNAMLTVRRQRKVMAEVRRENEKAEENESKMWGVSL